MRCGKVYRHLGSQNVLEQPGLAFQKTCDAKHTGCYTEKRAYKIGGGSQFVASGDSPVPGSCFFAR